MRFSDIYGQNSVKDRLRNQVTGNRIPHAQLLLGSEGTGSLSLALAYASFLQCTNRKGDDSCGECSSCHKHAGFVHPDLHFSFPFTAKKEETCTDYINEWRKELASDSLLTYENWMKALDGENKQGNIPIRECRRIVRTLALKPFESEFKILIMWLPEYLGNTGNVLLKLMEEPPEKTIFLLVAEDAEKILTTILSRTQLIRIPPVDDAGVMAYLQAEKGLAHEEARRLAAMSAGSLVKAAELASSEENIYLEPFRNWLRQCYRARDLSGAMKWADEFAGGGRERMKGFFAYCLEILRVAVAQKHLDRPSGLSADEEVFAGNLGKAISNQAQAEKLYELFNNAVYEVSRNGNGKTILSDMSFKLARVLR